VPKQKVAYIISLTFTCAPCLQQICYKSVTKIWKIWTPGPPRSKYWGGGRDPSTPCGCAYEVYGTAPTEGRFARPERRWRCSRGTPSKNLICTYLHWPRTGQRNYLGSR